MKILIIEDSDVAVPIKKYIERMFAPDQAEVAILKSMEGVPEFVKQERPEVILLDLTMPGANTDEIIAEFIPVLAAISDVMICSSRIESKMIRRCILAGANDYVRKDELFADGFEATITKFRSRLESAYYRSVRARGIHSPPPSIPFPTGAKSDLPITQEPVY